MKGSRLKVGVTGESDTSTFEIAAELEAELTFSALSPRTSRTQSYSGKIVVTIFIFCGCAEGYAATAGTAVGCVSVPAAVLPQSTINVPNITTASKIAINFFIKN